MIRINLLGQPRPKAARRAVPLGAMAQLGFFIVAIALAFGIVWLHYGFLARDLRQQQDKLAKLRVQKANLENLKQQVDAFERQKAVLQQRIGVIEELQRNRTGAQELLDAVANTVSRTDTLWLTSMTRKGNSLSIEGTAASVNAVANFITQLKRSGYFDKIEIKEAKQDERSPAVQVFTFTLNADFTLPQGKPAATAAATSRPGAAPAPPAPAPPRKGYGEPMATAFREFPWYVQALIIFLVFVVLLAVGEFLPFLPVAQTRSNLDTANADYAKLNQEVTALQVYQRRYIEFKNETEALQKQLETLRTIVPEEKELDEFIRLVQGAATAANVQIRRMTAQPIVPREYHYEMPFELQVDGPYFNILYFFSRLSRLSRIINVGDINFTDVSSTHGAKYPVRPGTTVSGTFMATTFFTKTAAAPPAKAPAKPPGKK